jgi:hypothetical protein
MAMIPQRSNLARIMDERSVDPRTTAAVFLASGQRLALIERARRVAARLLTCGMGDVYVETDAGTSVLVAKDATSPWIDRCRVALEDLDPNTGASHADMVRLAREVARTILLAVHQDGDPNRMHAPAYDACLRRISETTPLIVARSAGEHDARPESMATSRCATPWSHARFESAPAGMTKRSLSDELQWRLSETIPSCTCVVPAANKPPVQSGGCDAIRLRAARLTTRHEEMDAMTKLRVERDLGHLMRQSRMPEVRT